jgi:HEAT repeat protein
VPDLTRIVERSANTTSSIEDRILGLAAARVLGNVGTAARSSVPVLARWIRHNLGDLDASDAAAAIGQIGGADGRRATLQFLRSQDSIEQAMGIVAAAKVTEGREELVHDLGTLVLSLVDGPPRWTAMGVLGECGVLAKPAIPALVAALTSSDDKTRRYALKALGRIRVVDADAQRRIGELAETDPSEMVRSEAQTALTAIRGAPR